MTAGNTYYVTVTGWAGTTGDYTVEVDFDPDQQPFEPVFWNASLEGVTDNDGDGKYRSQKVGFDVDSNVAGQFYVEIYDKDTVTFDDYITTSPTYSVNGNASNWHYVTFDVESFWFEWLDTADIYLKLYDAATDTYIATRYLGTSDAELAEDDRLFEPVFWSASLEGVTDNDGQGDYSSLKVGFDVDSNVAGQFYVEVHDNDPLFDDLITMSPTYSVDGNASDWHYVTFDVESFWFEWLDAANIYLKLYDAATSPGTYVATWDLGTIDAELPEDDRLFEPAFSNATLEGVTDNDGQGDYSSLKVGFDVDSNVAGQFYVEVHDNDPLFDDLITMSPTYSVDGNASDWHYVTFDVESFWFGWLDTANIYLELYDAATSPGTYVATWNLGTIDAELVYEDADEHEAKGLVEKGIEKLLTMGKTYYEQRNEHPVLGGAISVEASLFADALTLVPAAAPIMAPVARVLDIAGTSIDFGMYMDLADLLLDGNGDWWTQDGDDGYVTIQLTAGGTLLSASFLPDSPISFSGSLAAQTVENFRHGEPELTGATLIEVDLGYGPLEVSFGAGLSLGFELSATDWKLDVGIDALSVRGVFLALDVRRDVLWSLFNSTRLYGSMSDVFLSAVENAVGINLGSTSSPSLADILFAQVMDESLPPVVRWAAPETTGEIVAYDGGYDGNGDGVGDGYYPAFVPDWLGSPPAEEPFLTNVTLRNTGVLSDDYFVKLRDEPDDWFVGAYDGFWPAAWDTKVDVTDVPASTNADTPWLVGAKPGAVEREIVFDLYHDKFGFWANEYLGSYRVTLKPGVPQTNQEPIIGSLSDNPDRVTRGQDVTLTANNVSDPDGDVLSVAFYRETNSNAGLQTGPGGDTLVGIDDSGSGGWTTTFSTAGRPAGTYTYYAQATDDLGDSSPDGTSASSTVNTVKDPVVVENIVINDGSDQRSMVTSLTVNFSGLVTLDPGAFEVVKTGTGGGPVTVNVAASEVGGKTVATLTFSGGLTEYGSLKDGNYELTVHANRVRDSVTGGALDGDGDGLSGGDRVFGDQAVDAFFRFFGDWDGDRDVDNGDFLKFRQSFRKTEPDSAYVWYLDFDGDGDVDNRDFLKFRSRFRKSISFV